jgi:hypothetical protein
MDVRRLGRVAPSRKTDGETCNGVIIRPIPPRLASPSGDLVCGMRTGNPRGNEIPPAFPGICETSGSVNPLGWRRRGSPQRNRETGERHLDACGRNRWIPMNRDLSGMRANATSQRWVLSHPEDRAGRDSPPTLERRCLAALSRFITRLGKRVSLALSAQRPAIFPKVAGPGRTGRWEVTNAADRNSREKNKSSPLMNLSGLLAASGGHEFYEESG